MNAGDLSRLISAACKGKPDLVIRDARVINVFTNEITETNVAISGGTVIGVGNFSCENEYNAHGAYLAPLGLRGLGRSLRPPRGRRALRRGGRAFFLFCRQSNHPCGRVWISQIKKDAVRTAAPTVQQ